MEFMQRHSSRALSRIAWLAAALGIFAPNHPSAQQPPEQPAPANPQSASDIASQLAPIPDEDEGEKVPLMLNNVPIDQLVQVLSDLTGKPVFKQKDINQQVTVTSPGPVTRRQALNLISEALRLDNIYLVETADQVQILPITALRNLPVISIPMEVDIQTLPDSFQMAQKIYTLKFVRPENLRPHLERLVPDTAMTYDAKTNTLIIKDTVVSLKRYDLIIRTLDQEDKSDFLIETFELKHIDAMELAVMLGNVLMNTSVSPDPSGRTAAAAMAQMQAQLSARRSTGTRDRMAPTPIVVGDITLVPDTRMNRLIVSAPGRRMEELRTLVADFDRPESQDMSTRMLEIKYIDTTIASTMVNNLLRDIGGGAAKDVIRVIPYDDGNSILVYSSQANFDLIRGLIEKLDVEGAEKRETRNYQLEHLTAQEMADQLTELWDTSATSRRGQTGYSYNYNYNYNNATTTMTRPSFVPSPRTNSLMVLARPKDFPFIEEMIKELDLPVKEGAFDPHIYHIRHTDANELVKVLESLFQDTKSRNSSYYFRQPAAEGSIESLFGELRFVVDNVTNTIVALASNPKTYPTLDALVAKLDQGDPQATEVLVVELKHADALEVATHLNNLFSDGVFSAPPQQPAQQKSAPTSSSFTSSALQKPQILTYFPWQAAQRSRSPLEESRPINTMIGNVRVVPDSRANKLIVAAPPIYFDSLQAMIEQLDQAEPQVHIKTRIIEISRGDERRVGLRWTPDPGSIDPAELDNAILALSNFGYLNSFNNNGAGATEFTNEIISGGNTRTFTTATRPGSSIIDASINVALLAQLLVKNNKGRILSEPALTVNNNEPGELFVGSRFPFRVNSQITDNGGSTFGIEYRDVGIKLLVTPHINLQGEVVLTADLENSRVRDQLIDGQVVEDTSRFHSEIAVESGQTMVIGGIVVEDSSNINRSAPVLGKIPVIKHLFSKTDRSEVTRELVVLITPEVISDQVDIQAMLKRAIERMGEDAPQDWSALETPPPPNSDDDPAVEVIELQLAPEPQAVEINPGAATPPMETLKGPAPAGDAAPEIVEPPAVPEAASQGTAP